MTTLFVTGTDTNVGKTVIATGLLEFFNQMDLKTIGLKPVSAGCSVQEGKSVNDDALLLQKTASVSLPYEDVNPFAFTDFMAPHISANNEGRRLSLTEILDKCRSVPMDSADVTLIEGAGGWFVPLNDDELFSDLVQQMQIPVLVVVGMKLGCLNHAALTAYALKSAGIPIAGWVANCVEPNMPVLRENIFTLKRTFGSEPLAIVPLLDEVSPDALVKFFHQERTQALL